MNHKKRQSVIEYENDCLTQYQNLKNNLKQVMKFDQMRRKVRFKKQLWKKSIDVEKSPIYRFKY